MGYDWSLDIEVPFLPPSLNRAYIPRLRKVKDGVALTKVMDTKARSFIDRFRTFVAQKYLLEINSMPVDETVVFRVDYVFFFETLINKTWGKKSGAKSRYAIVDVTNRITLLENAIKVALDMDDCRYFGGSFRKEMDPGNVRTQVTITAQGPEEYSLPPL